MLQLQEEPVGEAVVMWLVMIRAIARLAWPEPAAAAAAVVVVVAVVAAAEREAEWGESCYAGIWPCDRSGEQEVLDLWRN